LLRFSCLKRVLEKGTHLLWKFPFGGDKSEGRQFIKTGGLESRVERSRLIYVTVGRMKKVSFFPSGAGKVAAELSVG